MKLSSISEEIKGSRETIRNAAVALGELIRFVYDTGQGEELQGLDTYLTHPTPRGWEKISWIIDSAMQKAAALKDDSLTDQMKHWAELKSLTSPVIVAATYDIEPPQVKGTPMQKVALSRPQRNKMKLALGPQGYVSTLSQAGSLPSGKLKNMSRNIARSSSGLTQAAKTDIPNVQPRAKF